MFVMTKYFKHLQLIFFELHKNNYKTVNFCLNIFNFADFKL